MKPEKWKAIIVLSAILGAFCVGVVVHQQSVSAQAITSIITGKQPSDVDMTQFWTAYELLNQKFIVTHASSSFPTKQEQLYGAIEGLAASFGDPYTVFLPPSDAQVFQENISGSFGGIGLQIDNNAQGQLVAVSPLKGTPAAAADIQPGDRIIAIGATSSVMMPSDQAVKLIRGPVGTNVQLTIERGTAKPFTITLTRQTINIPIIETQMLDGGIFKISLYSFSENSTNLFRNALREFMQSGSNKLILDLRGNPGGYLEAAVDMASYFLPVGDTIVTEDFTGKQNNIVHRSVGYNVFANRDLKMVILVNQGSASASEILAGALQQHGVAKLVGTRTFGKGSVQELIDLGNGAELKVTIARWLIPNGDSISDGGLKPDVFASTTPELVQAGKDVQLDAAVNYLLSH